MKMIVYFLCCLSLLLCGCAENTEVYNIEPEDEESSVLSESEVQNAADSIVVYICGEVINPGIYTLEEDSRIFDAAEAAGGFTDDADVTSLNLAQKLTDGQQIIVYAVSAEVGDTASGSVSSGISASGKININRASKDELMTLSGIGEAKAQAIIDYRDEIGWFTSTDQLMNISGIGEKMYARIADDIEV